MPLPQKPAFSLLGWSLAVFLVYVLIQVLVTFTYALFGVALHPALGLFVWFATSAAIGHSLLLRHRPSRTDLALLQGFACLYVALIALAIGLRSAEPFELLGLAQILIIVVGFFIAGLVGFELARVLRDWLRHPSSARFR